MRQLYYNGTRSHRQIVPSSQTESKIEPSRLKLVCLTAVLHLGWVSVIDRMAVGSVTSKSQTYNLPDWFPNARICNQTTFSYRRSRLLRAV